MMMQNMLRPGGRSPLAWVGGKSLLAETIIKRFPPHTCYVEVFAGAAWVLFKKQPSKVEVINDLNGELVRLYRCVRHHLPALVEQFRWMLVAREEFDAFLSSPPEALTDIQRAARFFYLAKTAFGAKAARPTFGTASTGLPRLNLLRIEEELSDAHARLARVTIENRPYADVLKRYDRESTLFYLDPPYWGCEDYYGEGMFERADFERLAELLVDVKGKFILSLNDTPGVRETFAMFNIAEVPTRYSVNASRSLRVTELLIDNLGASMREAVAAN